MKSERGWAVSWARALALSGGVAVAVATSAPTAEAGADPAASAAPSPHLLAAQKGEVHPPDTEDIEHMCALLSSCPDLPLPPQLVQTDVASCVRTKADELSSPAALKFSLTMRECGLRTSSCGELRKCVLRGAKPDACKGRGQGSVAGMCDSEGRAITCFKDHILAVRDCPRGGESCAVRDGQATCILGPCTAEVKEGAPPSCSASGTRILRCDKGKLTSLDCSAFGLRCTMGEEGAVACSTPTPSCSGTAKRCDGNVAVGCLSGHEVRVDCGAAGLVCNPVPGGAPVGACVAPPPAAGACDGQTPAKCDGATIKYCLAGKPRSYFCKSLGFAKCAAEGKAVHCVL